MPSIAFHPPPAAPPLSSLVLPKRHIPNALTIARVLLAAVFFLILALWNVNDPHRQPGSVDLLLLVAAAIFVVAAATDALDGHLARKWSVVSVFGRVMDPFADKILILGAFVMLAGPAFLQLATREQTSHVLPWMAVLILARELLITSLRAAFESRGIDFSAGPSGKLKMILQSICVPIVLVAVAVRPALSPETGDLLTAIAMWSVWLTVAVTVWSAIPYIARALAISRALPPTTPQSPAPPTLRQ